MIYEITKQLPKERMGSELPRRVPENVLAEVKAEMTKFGAAKRRWLAFDPKTPAQADLPSYTINFYADIPE